MQLVARYRVCFAVLCINAMYLIGRGVACSFPLTTQSVKLPVWHGTRVGNKKMGEDGAAPSRLCLRSAAPECQSSRANCFSDETIYYHHHHHQTNQSNIQLHLFSLQWTDTTDNDTQQGGRRFSKAVADTWRWKDAVLGDGRDFFVPKPKTLRALSEFLLQSIPFARECVVLSNCARLEVLLLAAMSRDDTKARQSSAAGGDQSKNNHPIERSLSEAIMRQVASYQARGNNHLDLMQMALDRPSLIDAHALLSRPMDQNNVLLLEPHHWIHWNNDIEGIIRHLCFVASGMALRPRRPGRTVIFRPFSSRDAHIMLQLKRTLETVAVASDGTEEYEAPVRSSRTKKTSSSSSLLAGLLRHALRAGKAVRNPSRLPDLNRLQQFGTGDSKFSTEPPAEVSNAVRDVSTIGVRKLPFVGFLSKPLSVTIGGHPACH